MVTNSIAHCDKIPQLFNYFQRYVEEILPHPNHPQNLQRKTIINANVDTTNKTIAFKTSNQLMIGDNIILDKAEADKETECHN